jgi:tripartite motif-containing protein 71
VADTANHRVEEFNSSGTFTEAIGWGVTNGKEEFQICTTTTCKAGIKGTGNGQFEEPTGIAFDASGHLWVADSELEHGRIEEFTSKGEFVKQIKTEKHGEPGEAPSAITIDSSGNPWVIEASEKSVEEFSPEGALLESFKLHTELGGKGESPSALAVSANYVYVLQRSEPEVEEYTIKGEDTYKSFGSYGTGNGQLAYPTGLAIGPEGNFWIADGCCNDRLNPRRVPRQEYVHASIWTG